MRIQQLQYIIKIVETGSMNEAAKQLFITQPSLPMPSRTWKMRWGLKSLSGILKGSLWPAMGWSSSLMPARWWSRSTSCPSAIKILWVLVSFSASLHSTTPSWLRPSFHSLKKSDMEKYELFPTGDADLGDHRWRQEFPKRSWRTLFE